MGKEVPFCPGNCRSRKGARARTAGWLISSTFWVTQLGCPPSHWRVIFLVLDCWLSELEWGFLTVCTMGDGGRG